MTIARHNRARRVVLLGSALSMALIVLLVLVNLERQDPARPALDGDIIELVPEPLAIDGAAPLAADPLRPMPVLEQGGSIQFAAAGRPAQQYRFERMDPHPPGLPPNWVKMERPSAEIFLADGRVLALAGDSAVAHLPEQVLESGTLTGNVTIRLLEAGRDEPTLLVSAPEARFDNVIGEVGCDADFRVETPSLEFSGQGLTMLVNDEAEDAELSVEVRHVERLRLARGAAGAAAPAQEPPPAAGPAALAATSGTAPQEAPQHDPRYYRLTLHDEVRIETGAASRKQSVAGDSLSVVFSSKTRDAAQATFEPPAAPQPAAGAATGHVPAAASPMIKDGPRALAPPLRDDDVHVTCTGPLTMVPIPRPPAEVLPSDGDALLEIKGRPVELADEGIGAVVRCDRLTYRSLSQRIDLAGSAAHPLLVTTPELAMSGEAFWLMESKGGLTGAGSLDSAGAGGTDARTLHMTWTDGLDLDFEDTGSGDRAGELRRATFRGGVHVKGHRPQDAGVRDKSGEMESDLLVVHLRKASPAGRGRPAGEEEDRLVPTLLQASGGVRSADADRVMWADQMHVVLKESGGSSEVDIVSAERNVQVALSDGTRAWADALTADAAAETVELRGTNIAVIRGPWMVDQGTTLLLAREGESAKWRGHGRARSFAEDIVAASTDRVSRPVRIDEPRVETTWSESLSFDGSAHEGAGAVEVKGDVRMVSRPQALQVDSLAGDAVTIELVRTEDSIGGEASGRAPGRIIARGPAHLESRTGGAGAEPEMLLYLAGSDLAYDAQTGEAAVPGPGEILIRDLRPEETAAAPRARRGTTSFRWSKRLDMLRRGETLREAVLAGDVEMRHLALDGSASTLACDRLEITIDRPGENTGAAAELRCLRGEGAIFLRTPERDVDCDVFLYDVAEGTAELSAAPGRFVTVYTRGQPEPVRLQRAAWDLTRDTVQATRGTGGGTR